MAKNNAPEYIYGAREIETGKLVGDITNPKKKFWQKKSYVEDAVNTFNRNYADIDHKYRNKGSHGRLEVVTFKLVEVKEDE